MLETIREYMREQLTGSGEGDTIARRHAAHYLADTQGRAATPGHAGWLTIPRSKICGPRWTGAWRRPGRGAGAGAGCYVLWLAGVVARVTHETQTVLERAIVHPQAAGLTARRADVCRELGDLLGVKGEFAAARRWFEQALRLYDQLGDSVQRAW